MVGYYVTYFTVMSVIGYIYESIAMTLWSGKWENRGFLYGPVIPIYGYGSLIGVFIFNYLMPSYSLTVVFLAGFFGSMLLEFPTSVILEKLFHAYWWDYSSAPLNIQGRVSFFSSLGFGIGALIIIYVINPVLFPILDSINPNVLNFLGYLFVALFTADTTLTVCVLTSFEEKVSGVINFVDDHMENAVENINPKGRNIKGALKFTKENIIDTGVDRIYDSMDGFYHGAISRIKGFKDNGSDKVHIIKSIIKDRIDKIRKEDER